MHRPIYVYTHDSNPDVDPPAFRITSHEAATRINKGYAVWISPSSIRTRSPGWTPDEELWIAGGLFLSAWRPRLSGEYLVWQMVSGGPT